MEPADQTLADEKARADAAEDRLRTQTLVRAEAEHRLKTALAVIGGWASTLDERWGQLSEDRRREAVGIIRRASDELADQARGLLEDARAELLSLDQEPVRLDLGAFLETSAAVFGAFHGHVVEVRRPEEPVLVEVDAGALQQVLGHLVENAVKYSPPGSRVTVSAALDHAEAVLEVVDEGIGVPEDDSVFDPFWRGAGVGHVPGVGLGLYIVRNLVASMGGLVAARRNAGRGSTFAVRLPARTDWDEGPWGSAPG